MQAEDHHEGRRNLCSMEMMDVDQEVVAVAAVRRPRNKAEIIAGDHLLSSKGEKEVHRFISRMMVMGVEVHRHSNTRVEDEEQAVAGTSDVVVGEAVEEEMQGTADAMINAADSNIVDLETTATIGAVHR